jgi:hypothetical protein
MKHISNEEAAHLLKRTEEVENQKEQRQAEREEKKRLKAQQEKRVFLEKLVAPILLLLTIGISFVLYLVYQKF